MTSDWRDKLRFPERDIARYAEYVSSDDLAVGSVYFRLSYLDDAMCVPELVPLVYVGRDLEATEGTHRRFFQDAGSYLAGLRWGDQHEPPTGETEEERLEQYLARGHFESFDEADGGGVLAFENALNLLLLCSLRRAGVT